MSRCEARIWAREEFGEAHLGDARRVERLVSMATRAASRPAGRVLQVFATSAERQGAYDLLANAAVQAAALTDAAGRAAALRCEASSRVYVSIDGSSLSLTDTTGRKGFGGVGATAYGGLGLKVVTALALESNGTIAGVADQQWWARPPRKKRHDCHKRSAEQKETQRCLDCIEASGKRLREGAPDAPIWFLLDREADRGLMLKVLAASGHTYVVRSSSNRRVVAQKRRYLLDQLSEVAPSHGYALDVQAGPGRTARRAHMLVRATRATLSMRDRITWHRWAFDVTVVEARETATTPAGEKPIVWRLLTNHKVATASDADQVLDAYAMRWSIESFHKTWKTGACNVEDMQGRSMSSVVKWATLMASVAARIERLKTLSREQPLLPADRELTPYELSALIVLKRKYKKRTETIPDAVPSLAQAVWWIAELGGYTGKSSGGPPGSITIQRGLDYLGPAAAMLESLEKQGKLR
jgi:hypothetical protein